MPAAPTKGLKVAVNNTPQAKDDAFSFGEDASSTQSLNVLANDGGGNAATLWGLYSGPALTNYASLISAPPANSVVLASGSIATIGANGTIDYDSSGLNFNLDTLAVGEVFTESFSYIIRMANGAFSVASVTITLTGENDAPVAEAQQIALLEGDSETGQLEASDIDNGAVLTFSADETDGLTLNDDGSYTFDAGDAAYDHLAEGVEEDVEITFTVTDEHGATDTETLTVTITGVNDAAVITGEDTGEVTEDGTLVASGTLLVDDVDDGEDSFTASTATTALGAFVFNADGTWTYTLDNVAAQSLDADDVITESFTVESIDGTEHTVEVTVNGADEPVTYVAPAVYTGTGDPNDFDSLGNAAGQNLSGASGNTADTMYGGAGNDTINSGNGADTVYGGSGADNINGAAGDDALYGGSGNDTINGSGQADDIIGGYGADTVTGAGGNDTVHYLSELDTGDTITDFNLDGDDVINFSALSDVTAYQGQVFTAGEVNANSVSWYNDAPGSVYVYADTNGDAVADIELHLTGVNSVAAADFLL